jgi:hypothetical protein
VKPRDFTPDPTNPKRVIGQLRSGAAVAVRSGYRDSSTPHPAPADKRPGA